MACKGSFEQNPTQQAAVAVNAAASIKPSRIPRLVPRQERAEPSNACRVLSMGISNQQASVAGSAESSAKPNRVPRLVPRQERADPTTHRLPNHGVAVTAQTTTKPGQLPYQKRAETRKTSQMFSVRVPRRKEAKPALQSARKTSQPISRKAPSRVPTQTQESSEHKKPGCSAMQPIEKRAVDRGLGTTAQTTHKSISPRVKGSYRPKGGFIFDPELTPLRTMNWASHTRVHN